MEKKLQIAYINKNKEKANEFKSILEQNGYRIEISNKDILENEICLLLFYKGITLKDIFSDIPWLKKQSEKSTIAYLRLFPIFLFDRKEEIELDINEYLPILESLISGEFKPYGFNLKDKNSIVEFNRILKDSYSE
ncbi:MAG TPA: hypothetical protein DEF61_05585 [Firmicutes bacterium]|nr:hypothetical protein [Bacillota bacterium]HBX25693.1 hypothetical protein [Bacillota bacterium]